eukprot:2174711-Amphidinium_carterae.1
MPCKAIFCLAWQPTMHGRHAPRGPCNCPPQDVRTNTTNLRCSNSQQRSGSDKFVTSAMRNEQNVNKCGKTNLTA